MNRQWCDEPTKYRRALCLGYRAEPGEALTRHDRRVLVSALHGRGWTDRWIAEHTAWTDYTVARIRDDIGLEPNVADLADRRAA